MELASASVSSRLRPEAASAAVIASRSSSAEFAEMQQAVDEQAQPLVGGQTAGGGVRGKQQAGVGQVGHHVADGGRRQVHRQPARERAAADRLAGLHVLFDDLAQNRGGAGIEPGRQRGTEGDAGGVAGAVHGKTP